MPAVLAALPWAERCPAKAIQFCPAPHPHLEQLVLLGEFVLRLLQAHVASLQLAGAVAAVGVLLLRAALVLVLQGRRAGEGRAAVGEAAAGGGQAGVLDTHSQQLHKGLHRRCCALLPGGRMHTCQRAGR